MPAADDFPPLAVEPPPPSNGNGTSSPAQWQEVNDLTRATRSFAQFFNGVVVDLDTGNTETTDEEGAVAHKMPAAGLPVEESEPPEDDMPF
jgi:hypothetical protein